MKLKLLLTTITFLIATSTQAAIISTFSGGDVGDGLDLQGTFAYAIDFGGNGAVTIGDATFTNDSVSGFSWSAQNHIANWHTANYGVSSNDNGLESVMRSIRWSAYPNAVTLGLDLNIGEEYQLQLLFAESCCNRGFDVFLEDTLEVDGFNVGINQGGINNPLTGVAITYNFIATDDLLNVRLIGDQTFPDSNPILNALTLEKVKSVPVPEPDTLILLLAGVVGFSLAQKKQPS